LILTVYAPYGIQPGGKISTLITIKHWQSSKVKKEQTFDFTKNLFVSPEIGFFARPKNHISLLINSDIGFRRRKEENRFYTDYALGIGYLSAFQTITTSFSLGTGDVSNKNREYRAYFLPTINFGFGQQPKNIIGWCSKLTYGRKISAKIEDSAFFSLEFGLIVKLGGK